MNFSKLFTDTFQSSLATTSDSFWYSNKFCHYTNLTGLLGIIEKQQIWLSDHRFLNDELEISYGRSLAIDEITKISATESNYDFAQFLGDIITEIKQPSDRVSYIGSMSLAIDALDQWRGYTYNNDGVCIVFNGESDLWNKGYSHPTHIRQQKIIYDKSEQVSVIRKFISKYRSEFDGFKSFQYPFISDLAWLIESQFITFKDSQYESEQEVRLTIQNLDQVLKEKPPMHRVKSGLLIPYITTNYISKLTNFQSEKLPITEIIISPTSRPGSVASIQAFLKNKGYGAIPVSPSKIKFRG